MKQRKALLGILALLTLVGTLACSSNVEPRPAPRYGGEVRIEIFHDALSPYGDWVLLADYGWIWIPGDMPVGWRPYTHGQWLYTNLGWTWSSYWTWGWAPFHYGRWIHHHHHGWIWIPGRHWAPAWVAWRSGPGWYGWAPLPYGARWSVEFGLQLSHIDFSVAIAPHSWIFVGDRHLLAPDLRSHIVAPERNAGLFKSTRDVTVYRNHDRWIAERGLEVAQVERSLGRQVPRYRLEDLRRPPSGQLEPANGTVHKLYRPRVPGAPASKSPPGKKQGRGKGSG